MGQRTKLLIDFRAATAVTFTALMLTALASSKALAEPPMAINVPLEVTGWQAQAGQVRPSELPRLMEIYDGPTAETQPARPFEVSRARGENCTVFHISLNDAPYGLRAMVWTRPLPEADLAVCHYFLLTYRTSGIARSYAPLNAVAIVGKDATGKQTTVPLLPVAAVLNDNLWHTVVGQATFPVSGVVRVLVGTKDADCSLRLGELKLLEKPPALTTSDLHRNSSPTGLPALHPAACQWQCLDLSRQFNDTCAAAFSRLLKRQSVVIDGVNALSGQPIMGIPFRIGGAAANIIHPADTRADQQPIEFLGVKTTRHFVRPPGRDDTVVVDVNHKASEVLFLMISEMRQGGPRYALPPGPHDYNDIGALSVELQYDTGQPDIAFPYSLADGGFTAYRMAGVYAVAADPTRTIKRLILHNHVIGNDHSLAAVTLNVGPHRLLPDLVQEPPPLWVKKLPAPRPHPPYLRRDGELLKLGNSACDLAIDCSHGFAFTELVNRYGPTRIKLDGGLQVRVGDKLLTGRAFRATAIHAAGNQAIIDLESLVAAVPLALKITVTVDEQQVRFQLSAINHGAQALSPSVRFPLLDKVAIGSAASTWMFFPQYRNVLTRDNGAYLVGNDRSFPMQFLDIFNPAAGVGLGLLTRNTNLMALQYGISKDSRGVSAFVQSPTAFSKLAPGQTLTMPETVLLPHAGDWHVTMNAYQQWLRSVSSPLPDEPQRQWFRKLFAMRVHLTKKVYSWAFPIYNPATRQYRIDQFIKADTSYLGMPPQIIHLGGWCDYNHNHGGDFLGGDYAVKDYTGGLNNLRAAIRKLQDDYHIPVSLYTIPDRCRKTSEIGEKLGRRACRVRADGWVGDDGPVYYVCPAYRPWQDHYIAALKRTQQELGVKAIYVDVFGFAQNSACYSPDHGHPVPSNPNQVSYDLIRRLRAALPPGVALWSEFPLDDVTARYLDGNINYYCLNWHEYFSHTYDAPQSAPSYAPTAQDAYRYVFPDNRQFVFLCGSQDWSSECKFPFFNGEALYDTSWFLYAGKHLDLVRRALALQKKYTSCFTSQNPVMEVPTDRWQVHANKFPGPARTIWTLYNARYTTVAGPVLTVPYQPGATYFDAWNNRPLKPVIRGNQATISLRLEPQALGCIVAERGG